MQDSFGEAVEMCLDIIRKDSSEDSASSKYIELFNILTSENCGMFSVDSVQSLFAELHRIRTDFSTPEVTKIEKVFIEYIIRLIDDLEDEEFEVFYKYATKDKHYIREVYLLIQNAKDRDSKRVKRLLDYLEETKILWKDTKKDIYTQQDYLYGVGTFLMNDGDAQVWVYDNMEDKDCLLLALLDAVSILVLPNGGYRYEIKEDIFNSLEKNKLLKQINKCSPCVLRGFIKNVIRFRRAPRARKYIKFEQIDMRRLARGFWANKKRILEEEERE